MMQHVTFDLQNDMLCLCNYPFVFDGPAKSVLLQTDALIQMQVYLKNSWRLKLIIGLLLLLLLLLSEHLCSLFETFVINDSFNTYLKLSTTKQGFPGILRMH